MAAELLSCISFCKDTNLKANHNHPCQLNRPLHAVFPFAKILIWKQITTKVARESSLTGCISFCKDTNLKANHNKRNIWKDKPLAVFPFAKILIWKQITTVRNKVVFVSCCISFCKDTNLKANHNACRTFVSVCRLYFLLQRY